MPEIDPEQSEDTIKLGLQALSDLHFLAGLGILQPGLDRYLPADRNSRARIVEGASLLLRGFWGEPNATFDRLPALRIPAEASMTEAFTLVETDQPPTKKALKFTAKLVGEVLPEELTDAQIKGFISGVVGRVSSMREYNKTTAYSMLQQLYLHIGGMDDQPIDALFNETGRRITAQMRQRVARDMIEMYSLEERQAQLANQLGLDQRASWQARLQASAEQAAAEAAIDRRVQEILETSDLAAPDQQSEPWEHDI